MRRKPTALKRFEGNPGHRRLADDDFQPEGEPVKPAGLPAEAEKLWDFIVPELVRKGVAKRCDTPMLTAMVEWWGRYREASAVLAADPLDYRVSVLAMMAQKSFERIAKQFGLDPVARAGLKLDAAQPSPLVAKFLMPRRS